MSSGSRYAPSRDDGLLARISGPWAQEKLTYLDKYMHLFSVGMKGKWRRVYLDLLAGTGRCIEDKTREEFDGSPLRALSCAEPFDETIFIEGDPPLAAALTTRVAGRGRVLEADCNDASTIKTLRSSLGHGILGLAFIDNLGLDVPLATIRDLSDQRLVDLFIVFQYMDLKRNLRDVLAGKHSGERWDAFFGSGWQDVAQAAEKDNLSAEETVTKLLDFYAQQLEGIGYKHIAHSRRVMKNSRRVGLYRLILAGKHERAVEFFNKVGDIDPVGQRSLL